MKWKNQKKYVSMLEAIELLQGNFPIPQGYQMGMKWIIKQGVEMIKVDEGVARRYYIDRKSLLTKIKNYIKKFN